MFGTWIGQIVKTYDYINRIVITLPLSVYEGTWTHSPLSLLCITMILRVHRIFFEITTFPNRGAVRLILDRLDREDVRLHQPRCANTSAFGLRGYVDTLSPLVAMHHHDPVCA